MFFPGDNTITVNGVAADLCDDQSSQLARAIILSLFTWRRAAQEDVEPGESRLGWCGDSLSVISGDKFGSRLWLLARENVTARTMARAKEYAGEALQWLIDDGVCASINISVERMNRNGIAMQVTLYRSDRQILADLRFSDVWSAINGT